MKKLLLMVVCFFSFSAMAMADDDKPIHFNQLPVKAQTFIRNHFNRVDIKEISSEDNGKHYEVEFKRGIQIEFDRNGRWKEIETDKAGIPDRVVPVRVLRQIKKRFGNQIRVTEMSREEGELKVKLSNGKELEFDRDRKRGEIDD